MTRDDDIYAAGYFDGEGTLSIQRAPGGAGPGSRLYHFMVASVSSTNREILDWFAALYGGGISPIKVGPRCKPAWRWQIRSQQAEDFLRHIHPFVRGKRPQIDLALEFRSTIQPRGGMVNGRKGTAINPVTADIEAHRERLRLTIRSLNQRGVPEVE